MDKLQVGLFTAGIVFQSKDVSVKQEMFIPVSTCLQGYKLFSSHLIICKTKNRIKGFVCDLLSRFRQKRNSLALALMQVKYRGHLQVLRQSWEREDSQSPLSHVGNVGSLQLAIFYNTKRWRICLKRKRLGDLLTIAVFWEPRAHSSHVQHCQHLLILKYVFLDALTDHTL